jgi:hypothetical protein
MFQKIELRKTRDFSAKINVTFEFLKQNFQPLAKSLIFISGPFVLLQGLFNGLYQKQILSVTPSSASNPFGLIADAFVWLGLTFLFLVMGYISSLIVVNEFARLYETHENPSDIEVGEIWEGVKKKFLPILLAAFVAAILVFISAIFFIIPGIYVAITLSLIGPVMIIEGRDLGAALSRCFSLITEKWWSTFGLTFVTGIIASTMAFFFAIPQYVFMFLIGIHRINATDPPALWQQAGLIVSSMIYTMGANLLQSIVMVAILFQFYNLVERREARGLMDKVESFGKPDSSNPDPDETY